MFAIQFYGQAVGAFNTLLNSSTGSTVGLFDNDVNPGAYDDFATILNEASFTGYAAGGPLTDFTNGTLPGPDEVMGYSPTTVAFSPSADIPGGVLIYGYFLKTTAGQIVMANRFPSPIKLQMSGETLLVGPKYSVKLDAMGAAV